MEEEKTLLTYLQPGVKLGKEIKLGKKGRRRKVERGKGKEKRENGIEKG